MPTPSSSQRGVKNKLRREGLRNIPTPSSTQREKLEEILARNEPEVILVYEVHPVFSATSSFQNGAKGNKNPRA